LIFDWSVFKGKGKKQTAKNTCDESFHRNRKVNEVRFVFWEVMKTVALILLALLSAKAIGGIRTGGAPDTGRRLRLARGVLYLVLLALVAVGALGIGDDVAAELYFTASADNLDRSQVGQAYNNALSAVRLRPGVLRYWQMLAAAKLRQGQFRSLLEDQRTLQALSSGRLEESDAMRCALAQFFLGQFEQVIPLTRELIHNNRYYAAPYVLQGNTFLALKNYPEAERSFLEVLQILPSQEDAVEGLAHAHFLSGDTRQALAVLDETARHPFPPEARKRFASLKALYAE
jgi:tetratricopeptide (TPR) repeat protein